MLHFQLACKVHRLGACSVPDGKCSSFIVYQQLTRGGALLILQSHMGGVAHAHVLLMHPSHKGRCTCLSPKPINISEHEAHGFSNGTVPHQWDRCSQMVSKTINIYEREAHGISSATVPQRKVHLPEREGAFEYLLFVFCFFVVFFFPRGGAADCPVQPV